jgi:hypothetical protein
MSDRKPFIAVDADIDDARLEGLAQRKGVGTLMKPANEAGEGARQQPRVQSAAKPEPAIDPDTIPTPRTQMQSVKIEIPDYVYTELRVRAAHRRTTIKHVIMTSLRLEGFEIRDADMIEDGRRDRGGE